MQLSKSVKKNKTSLFRKLKLWIKQQLGWLGKPVILPYAGFGNSDEIFFIGCVSEEKALAKPQQTHTRWQNFISMIRRFTAEVLPGVKVKATFMGIEAEATTDEMGLFRFSISLINKKLNLPPETWIRIRLELADFQDDETTVVEGKILLITPDKSQFGIISDVDDTILISKSTHLIRKFRLMLFKNAFTRLPFEGVAAFYRALNKGTNEHGFNPIFYVSNSQWNLFDLILDFCRFRGIPEGVMLLQELRPFRPKKFIKKKRAIARHPHKVDKIRSILTTYPFLKFVMIGDSGQKDAEIYQQIALEFPGRVLAIYIRDVRRSREKKVLRIGNTLKLEDVDMLMINDTVYAARHAVKTGLINPSSLKEISREKELNQKATLKV